MCSTVLGISLDGYAQLVIDNLPMVENTPKRSCTQIYIYETLRRKRNLVFECVEVAYLHTNLYEDIQHSRNNNVPFLFFARHISVPC